MKDKMKKIISKINYEKAFKAFIVFMVFIIYLQLDNIKKEINSIDSQVWDIKREVRGVEYSISNIDSDCPNVEVDCLKGYDLLDIESKLHSIDSEISMIRLKIGY